MRGEGRAQTTVDFAIGMAIFLVALTTVVAFMPTMTQPFLGGQENPLLADRLASQLVDSQLGDPGSPSVLDATCTLYFFNASPDQCSTFNNSVHGSDVNGKLGTSDRRFVNVTLQSDLRGDGSIYCGDDGELVGTAPCDPGEQLLAIGDPPPSGSASVTVARRRALFEDEVVYVVVKVWS